MKLIIDKDIEIMSNKDGISFVTNLQRMTCNELHQLRNEVSAEYIKKLMKVDISTYVFKKADEVKK